MKDEKQRRKGNKLGGLCKVWLYLNRKIGRSLSLLFMEHPYAMIIPLKVELEIWGITCLQDDKTRLVLFSKVIDMPEHNPGNMGGTMRLGIRRTVFKTENSILSKFLRSFVL